MILETYWEQPEVTVAGEVVNIYPDLSSITLKKRKHQVLDERITKEEYPISVGIFFQALSDT